MSGALEGGVRVCGDLLERCSSECEDSYLYGQVPYFLELLHGIEKIIITTTHRNNGRVASRPSH